MSYAYTNLIKPNTCDMSQLGETKMKRTTQLKEVLLSNKFLSVKELATRIGDTNIDAVSNACGYLYKQGKAERSHRRVQGRFAYRLAHTVSRSEEDRRAEGQLDLFSTSTSTAIPPKKELSISAEDYLSEKTSEEVLLLIESGFDKLTTELGYLQRVFAVYKSKAAEVQTKPDSPEIQAALELLNEAYAKETK